MRHVMHGTDSYTAEQVTLESKHAPETVAERRAIYEAERQSVTAFEYADTAGYAVVTVAGGTVEAEIHAGTSAEAFQRVKLVG
jgi:hypothetical protein